jgi:hypothetical protein
VLSNRAFAGIGVLDQPGQHDAFLHGELVDVLEEVRPGRGLDTVRTAPEVHRIEVVLEDIVLAVLVGELHRDRRFLDLTGVTEVLELRDLPGVLLGDRGRALPVTARHVVPRGAHDALEVDAVVLVEGPVLSGDHGVLDVLGDRRELDDRAVLLADLRHRRLAIGVEDLGRLARERDLVGCRDAGEDVGPADE